MVSQVVLLFSIFLVLTIVFMGIYLGKVEGAGKKKWQLLLYLLVAGILAGLVSLLGFFGFTGLPLWIFILAQAWLLIIGILHIWLFEKVIKLENKNRGKILFSLTICFFGYALVMLAYRLIFRDPFPRLYFLPAFFFLAPTFVFIAFDYFVKIPVKVFKAWDFPAPGTLPDPSDSEMANPIIVNFEIRKKPGENRTVFKAKAPKGMALGKLFYFFVSDYNSRNPDNPVVFKDKEEKLYKWLFYHTANLIRGKVHLDPEITIADNRIRENSTVVCERIQP